MAAYIVVQVEVKDPARYDRYKSLVPSSLEKYGGRFIVRGGRTETLEGDWAPKRFVIVEFPSLDQAKAWWASFEGAGICENLATASGCHSPVTRNG